MSPDWDESDPHMTYRREPAKPQIAEVTVTLSSNELELMDSLCMGSLRGELLELVVRPRWWQVWRVRRWYVYLFRAPVRVRVMRPDGQQRPYRARVLDRGGEKFTAPPAPPL